MTNLLGKVFAEAAKLSAQEQDAFAAWILDELASERRWEKAFADSEDGLAQLADEALFALQVSSSDQADLFGAHQPRLSRFGS
jgi:hypothetical protein